MKPGLQHLARLLIGGCLLLPLPGTTEQAGPLYPFKANYNLSLGGMTFGSVSISLAIDQDRNYRYQAHTETTGVISVIRNDEVLEISRGRLDGQSIIPNHYSYSHKRPQALHQVDLSFRWDERKVINKTPESLWTMSIQPNTQDKFSQQLALILDLNLGREQYIYRVADGGRLKTYTYHNQGSERVETPAGNFHSIRIARQKGGRESNMTLWMSPELNYLPVRVIRQEEGNEFLMELESLSWEQ